MNKLSAALVLGAFLAAPAAAVQPQTPTPAQPQAGEQPAGRVPTLPNVLIVFERPDFNGESYQVREVRRNGVVTPRGNWPIRSFAIHPGDRWEICEQARFQNCVTIDRSVNDISRIGLPMGRIGSARQVTAPAATPAQ